MRGSPPYSTLLPGRQKPGAEDNDRHQKAGASYPASTTQWEFSLKKKKTQSG
jgi:hypothetical protein